MENGRPVTMAEITISVFKYQEENDVRQYYFNADVHVKEAMKIICQDFAGIISQLPRFLKSNFWRVSIIWSNCAVALKDLQYITIYGF